MFDQTHLIIAFLVAFLLGDAVNVYRLWPLLRLAIRERRMLALMLMGAVALAHLWMAWFFVSLLAIYYHRFIPPHYYSAYLAGVAACTSWLVVIAHWLWCRYDDRQNNNARKDQP